MTKKFTWHPFLFGLFPVLFQFAHNVKEVPPEAIIAPAALVVVLTAVLHLLLNKWLGHRVRTGMLLSLFWILFFSFEHVVNLLDIDGNTAAVILLGIVWLIILYTGHRLIKRSRGEFRNLSLVLTLLGTYLVLFQVGTAGYEIITREEHVTEKSTAAQSAIPPEDLPDIYHLILDAYGRNDILREIYNFDNSGFLSWLEETGFYVCDSSNANYGQTILSMISMFEMKYLDELRRQYGWAYDDRIALAKRIWSSRFFRSLQSYGYEVVSFSTGYAESEFRNADVYYEYEEGFSEFNRLLWGTTPLWRIFGEIINAYDMHRGQIEFIFEQLRTLSPSEEPQFVFAHVTLPHPPFVFDSLGNPRDPDIRFSMSDGDHLMFIGMTEEKYLKGYINNLRYANRHIKPVIENIIERTSGNVIIILQGDHGPGSQLHHEAPAYSNHRERFGILNAYYFPSQSYDSLRESITPINGFRIVSNKVFGTDYELLRDRSFFSKWFTPLSFIEVTHQLRPADSGMSSSESK